MQGLAKVVKHKENRDLDVARKILEVLDTYAEVCISKSGFTVNVLNFLTLFMFCLKLHVVYQGWNLQNACQNSQQGRP